MQTIIFLIQGGSDEPYEVNFNFDGQNMSASCTCQAGQNGQVCKHRLEILNGVSSKVISNNKTDTKQVADLLKGTPIENKLTQLKEAEKELEAVKKKVDSTKKEVAKIMRGL